MILTGTDPAFSAGVDLKEVAGETPSSRARRGPGEGPERGRNGLYRFLPLIDKPVIGAINGVAVTGGLEVALQCTFLVASERARFADTHARVGIMPGGGITVLMAQSIGLRRAIEMSLTGNFLTAEEALRPRTGEPRGAARGAAAVRPRLAADIVSNDQRSVRRLLQHYRQMANAATLDEAHLIEGYMAETWQRGAGQVGDRLAEVTARGRRLTSWRPVEPAVLAGSVNYEFSSAQNDILDPRRGRKECPWPGISRPSPSSSRNWSGWTASSGTRWSRSTPLGARSSR